MLPDGKFKGKNQRFHWAPKPRFTPLLHRYPEEWVKPELGVPVPRDFWLRIERPELNSFLLAPLSKEAGGTEACGTAVFRSREDADYQAILRTFDSLHEFLEKSPRVDMASRD
jgi:hypothetical protein